MSPLPTLPEPPSITELVRSTIDATLTALAIDLEQALADNPELDVVEFCRQGRREALAIWDRKMRLLTT